jgi:hypothetical protein
MASVPNTDTFSLQDVIDVVVPSSNDLQTCFNEAIDGLFDSTYSGTKTNLLNFRNYGLTNWNIYLLNIKTRPWYLGAGLPSEKYNLYEIAYITGDLFEVYGDYNPGIVNLTRRIYYQSDGSIWIDFGSSDCQFYRTSIPKILTIRGTHYETLMVPAGLRFWISQNAGFLKSLNENIIYSSIGGGGYYMDFNLVNGSTTPPSLSLDTYTLDFYEDLSPYTVNHFHIVADGDWFIVIDSGLTLDSYYGTGNAIITITLNGPVSTTSIYNIVVHCMSNSVDTLVITQDGYND